MLREEVSSLLIRTILRGVGAPRRLENRTVETETTVSSQREDFPPPPLALPAGPPFRGRCSLHSLTGGFKHTSILKLRVVQRIGGTSQTLVRQRRASILERGTPFPKVFTSREAATLTTRCVSGP